MTAADLTAYLGTTGMLLGTVALPAWRKYRKRLETTGATQEVTWEGINLAISKERDKAVAELKEQRQSHAAELQAMRAEMASTAAALKERHDAETEELRARIRYCQSEITRLHQELYDATHRPSSSSPG